VRARRPKSSVTLSEALGVPRPARSRRASNIIRSSDLSAVFGPKCILSRACPQVEQFGRDAQGDAWRVANSSSDMWGLSVILGRARKKLSFSMIFGNSSAFAGRLSRFRDL